MTARQTARRNPIATTLLAFPALVVPLVGREQPISQSSQTRKGFAYAVATPSCECRQQIFVEYLL